MNGASEEAVEQLRAIYNCVTQCEQSEDEEACSEQYCVEPVILCLGGRDTQSPAVTELRNALGGRTLTYVRRWSDVGEGFSISGEERRILTLCATGQFAYQEESKTFASGDIGDTNHSGMIGDGDVIQGQWQVYMLGAAYVLELARTDGRTKLVSMAVQDNDLYLDGDIFEVSNASECP